MWTRGSTSDWHERGGYHHAPQPFRLTDDLERWVLKPLFSFSGSGANVDPTPADIAAVPEAERSRTLLMRKVDYAAGG